MDKAHPDRKLYYNGIASIRYPVQCVLTALTTVFWGTSALLISLFDRRGKWVHACASNWGASIFRICNVRVHVDNRPMQAEINDLISAGTSTTRSRVRGHQRARSSSGAACGGVLGGDAARAVQRGQFPLLDLGLLGQRLLLDLQLAVADEAQGDGLHAAGGEPLGDLLPEQRAELVADQAIEDPARLLGVDAIHIDLPRFFESLLNG